MIIIELTKKERDLIIDILWDVAEQEPLGVTGISKEQYDIFRNKLFNVKHNQSYNEGKE